MSIAEPTGEQRPLSVSVTLVIFVKGRGCDPAEPELAMESSAPTTPCLDGAEQGGWRRWVEMAAWAVRCGHLILESARTVVEVLIGGDVL